MVITKQIIELNESVDPQFSVQYYNGNNEYENGVIYIYDASGYMLSQVSLPKEIAGSLFDMILTGIEKIGYAHTYKTEEGPQ